jgi:hypothetical protein
MSHIWSLTNVLWSNANWTWAEAEMVRDLIRYGVDATTLISTWQENQPYNPYRLSEEKQKTLIRLICKVKGQTYDESKEPKDFVITVKDVQLVVQAVTNIKVEIGA